MKTGLITLCLASAVVVLGGCASSQAGDVYSREDAQRTMSYREGTLIGVKRVRIEGTKSHIGTGTGAVVGGIAGSTVGQGKGAMVGAVLGAVAGGLAGAATEEGLTRENALELTVRMTNGENIIVVQAAGNDAFAVGDAVRVVQGGGKTRVTK